LLISCASQTRYIEIKEDDLIYEYGIAKFEVYPGDTLKIVESKVCRGGSGICYKVKKVQTTQNVHCRRVIPSINCIST
jgi:hypothetical protein